MICAKCHEVSCLNSADFKLIDSDSEEPIDQPTPVGNAEGYSQKGITNETKSNYYMHQM